MSHEPVDPHNNYTTSNKYYFNGAQLNEIPKSYRRFPKQYLIKNPIEFNEPLEKSSDITSHVFKHFKEKFNFKTPSYVLANEKFRKLAVDPWKYSYKKENTVYPNIKLQQIRKSCIDLSKY